MLRPEDYIEKIEVAVSNLTSAVHRVSRSDEQGRRMTAETLCAIVELLDQSTVSIEDMTYTHHRALNPKGERSVSQDAFAQSHSMVAASRRAEQAQEKASRFVHGNVTAYFRHVLSRYVSSSTTGGRRGTTYIPGSQSLRGTMDASSSLSASGAKLQQHVDHFPTSTNLHSGGETSLEVATLSLIDSLCSLHMTEVHADITCVYVQSSPSDDFNLAGGVGVVPPGSAMPPRRVAAGAGLLASIATAGFTASHNGADVGPWREVSGIKSFIAVPVQLDDSQLEAAMSASASLHRTSHNNTPFGNFSASGVSIPPQSTQRSHRTCVLVVGRCTHMPFHPREEVTCVHVASMIAQALTKYTREIVAQYALSTKSSLTRYHFSTTMYSSRASIRPPMPIRIYRENFEDADNNDLVANVMEMHRAVRSLEDTAQHYYREEVKNKDKIRGLESKVLHLEAEILRRQMEFVRVPDANDTISTTDGTSVAPPATSARSPSHTSLRFPRPQRMNGKQTHPGRRPPPNNNVTMTSQSKRNNININPNNENNNKTQVELVDAGMNTDWVDVQMGSKAGLTPSSSYRELLRKAREDAARQRRSAECGVQTAPLCPGLKHDLEVLERVPCTPRNVRLRSAGTKAYINYVETAPRPPSRTPSGVSSNAASSTPRSFRDYPQTARASRPSTAGGGGGRSAGPSGAKQRSQHPVVDFDSIVFDEETKTVASEDGADDDVASDESCVYPDKSSAPMVNFGEQVSFPSREVSRQVRQRNACSL